MNQAEIDARQSLKSFRAALGAKKSEDQSFQIKKAFVDGSHVEQLWLGHLSFDGHVFHGFINNRPIDIKNFHFGQEVVVEPSEVIDWIFVKEGILIGGYTTRVLYARLSAEDKASFDKEANFKFQ